MINNLYIYYILIIIIIGLILYYINKYLSDKIIYNEKLSPFECGLSSFNQSRSTFNVIFIIIAILFLPFDLEISSLLPYSLVLYLTNIYGLIIIIIFTSLLIIGLIYEYKTKIILINKKHIKSLNKYNLYNYIKLKYFYKLSILIV